MASYLTINTLMKTVHRAIHSSKARKVGAKAYSVARIDLPGLASQMVIPGVDVQDVLVPTSHLPVEEMARTLVEYLPFAYEDRLDRSARVILDELFGRLTINFTLLGETAGQRYARLLWALGKGLEKEVADSTLIIKAPCGEFGVREGKLVGGPYHGYEQDLDLAPILEESRPMKTRVRGMVEARCALAGRTDLQALWIFYLLCAVAEWDDRVSLPTLTKIRPTLSPHNEQELIKIALLDDDPLAKLHSELVPKLLNYKDFVKYFGPPTRKLRIRPDTRLKLVGKLQSLPFFN